MSYLENPPARVPLISQDTYAASGTGITGVSGGGGGTVPANLAVSSLTVNSSGPGGGQGYINMLSGAGGAVAELNYFLDELNGSRVSISAISLGDYQNIYGSPNRVITVVNQDNTVCGDLALGRLVLQDTGTTSDLGYIGVSSTNLYASFSSFTTPPSLNNVSSITGLSSINGQPYLPGGGGGVTSLNGVLGAVELTSSDNSVTITPALSSINLQASGVGSIPSNLNLSTLGIGGTGSGGNPPLNLAVRGGTTVSEIIGFSRPGYTTAAQGILSIYGDDANGQNTLSVVYLSTGTTVTAPINVSNVYADGLVNTSSITGLSSINGQPYAPGGGAVSPNLALSTLALNGDSTYNLNTLAVSGGSGEVLSINIGSQGPNSSGSIAFSAGNLSTVASGVLSIGVANDLGENALEVIYFSTGQSQFAPIVVSNAYARGFVNTSSITGLSSINGQPYAPGGGAVSPDLALSTLVMNPTGYVSTVSLIGVSSITNTDVINIQTTDDINLKSGGNVNIGADLYLANTFMSSILFGTSEGRIDGLSTINGVVYPPPASVPENLTISTLNVSSIAEAKTFAADLVSTSVLDAYSVVANYGIVMNVVNTQPGVNIDMYGLANSQNGGSLPTIIWRNIGYDPPSATLSTVGLGINGVSSIQFQPANMNISYPGQPLTSLCIVGDTPGGTGQAVTSLITSGVVFADNLQDPSCPAIGIKNGQTTQNLTIASVSSITFEGLQVDISSCSKLVGVGSINGIPWSAISTAVGPY